MLASVGDKSAFAGICTLSEYFPSSFLVYWRLKLPTGGFETLLLLVYGYHRIVSGRHAELRESVSVDVDRRSAFSAGVSTRRSIVVARDDVAVLADRQPGV